MVWSWNRFPQQLPPENGPLCGDVKSHTFVSVCPCVHVSSTTTERHCRTPQWATNQPDTLGVHCSRNPLLSCEPLLNHPRSTQCVIAADAVVSWAHQIREQKRGQHYFRTRKSSVARQERHHFVVYRGRKEREGCLPGEQSAEQRRKTQLAYLKLPRQKLKLFLRNSPSCR